MSSPRHTIGGRGGLAQARKHDSGSSFHYSFDRNLYSQYSCTEPGPILVEGKLIMVVSCQSCEQEFRSHDDWVAHMKAERELTECRICGKSFKTAHSRRQHTHWFCSICNVKITYMARVGCHLRSPRHILEAPTDHNPLPPIPAFHLISDRKPRVVQDFAPSDHTANREMVLDNTLFQARGADGHHTVN